MWNNLLGLAVGKVLFRKIHWYSAESRDGEYPSQCHISIQPTSHDPAQGLSDPPAAWPEKLTYIFWNLSDWLVKISHFFRAHWNPRGPSCASCLVSGCNCCWTYGPKGGDLGPIISSLLVSQVIQLTKPPTLCLNQVDEESDSAASAIQDWGLTAWRKKHFIVVLAPHVICQEDAPERRSYLVELRVVGVGRKKCRRAKFDAFFL